MKLEDVFFKSSNDYEIPDLLPNQVISTPPGIILPFAAWGSVSRKNRFDGTYHFYIDDYKFMGLTRDPDSLILTGALSVIEPNFSITNETPEVVALYRIYQKRWLSRYWQQERPGIALWVDVAVADGHREKSLIGVPRGWQRYCTTALEINVDDLDRDLEQVVYHSAGNPYTLLVYGGGKEVSEWCKNKENVIYMKHQRSGYYKPGQGTRRRLEREARERGDIY